MAKGRNTTSRTRRRSAEPANRPPRERLNLIRALEKETGTRLLCYVSGHCAEISRDDTLGFVDMLSTVPQGAAVDLLLHTLGGDIDVTEKLVMLLRAKVGDHGGLRVIVPDCAKSAGTLIALGANRIVMSDSSELGTIDPQIWLKDGRGNETRHSVLHYLDAYAAYEQRVIENPTDLSARVMIEKFEPATLHKLNGVRERARILAENLLKPRGLNWSAIVNEKLMNIKEYQSHGQPLGWKVVERLGLDVDYLSQVDARWKRYWRLYLQLRLAIKDNQRVFESNSTSMVLEAQ